MLDVSERFYSIQGEGKYAGYPAYFIRLSHCNLNCVFGKYRCDTFDVWKKVSEKIDE